MTRQERSLKGAVAHHSGQAAEAQVEALYAARGGVIADRRWRGPSGEIDLVVLEGDVVVFVEVKRATSHARAAERLSEIQIRRIMAAALEYLAEAPMGMHIDTRFDVALVDGQGRIELLENAFP